MNAFVALLALVAVAQAGVLAPAAVSYGVAAPVAYAAAPAIAVPAATYTDNRVRVSQSVRPLAYAPAPVAYGYQQVAAPVAYAQPAVYAAPAPVAYAAPVAVAAAPALVRAPAVAVASPAVAYGGLAAGPVIG